MDEQDIIKFLFELGQLKNIKNSGFRLLGVPNPPSVGEHALRAAQIGYVLATMEGYDKPLEVCTMLVFHDMGECRVGDINRVENRYVDSKEEQAVKEQVEPLGDMGKEILSLWEQADKENTTAGIIAKDADMLEHSFSAKEYLEQGFTHAQNWIDNSAKGMKTESAKKLIAALQQSDSQEWWQGLKKLKR